MVGIELKRGEGEEGWEGVFERMVLGWIGEFSEGE